MNVIRKLELPATGAALRMGSGESSRATCQRMNNCDRVVSHATKFYDELIRGKNVELCVLLLSIPVNWDSLYFCHYIEKLSKYVLLLMGGDAGKFVGIATEIRQDKRRFHLIESYLFFVNKFR